MLRITNKIINNTTVSNVNRNKTRLDDYNTQIATGKRIAHTSDDPAITARALRYRTEQSNLEQQLERNIEDADAWLKTTETAIGSALDSLKELLDLCESGINGDKSLEYRKVILTQLKSAAKEYFTSGNAEYTNLSLFTGHRTNLPLTFQADENILYSINEEFLTDSIDEVKHVAGSETLFDINAGNYDTLPYSGMTETDITENTYHRIRLSYNSLCSGTSPVSGHDLTTAVNFYAQDGSLKTIAPSGGDYQMAIFNSSHTISDGAATFTDPYSYLELHPSDAVFVEETGEIIFGSELYQDISRGVSPVDKSDIFVTYSKYNWKEGDLMPQHYFSCTKTWENENLAEQSVSYDKPASEQAISYNISSGLNLAINIPADSLFFHAVNRDIEEIEIMTDRVADIQHTLAELEKMMQRMPDDTVLKDQYDAAKKAEDYLNVTLQNCYENVFGNFQTYYDRATLALSDVGSRSERLDLIRTRLLDNLTNVKALSAANEQISTTDAATQLTRAQKAYTSSLSVTSQVSQLSLLNRL